MKYISIFLLFIVASFVAMGQQKSKEELEREKLQLKKELAETQKLLTDNKSKTKENLYQWELISEKVNIQDRLVENISNDIYLLDKNLITIQRDINRYDKLLDTLKIEYAKSMVYAYKNRSNYDFLNFIFSSKNFNDALKRIAYLKSYRNYREMQGQNIVRTQDLRKQRVAELTGTKMKKNEVLNTKDKELAILEKEKIEKDRILAELKKQGGKLAGQYAQQQARLRKTDNAIQAMIKRQMELARIEAKKEADRRRVQFLKEQKEAEARAKAEKEAFERNKPGKVNPNPTNNGSQANGGKVITPRGPGNVTVGKTPTTPTTISDENVMVTDANRATNTSFLANKGSLPWPAGGRVIGRFGKNVSPITGSVINQNCITIGTEVGAAVKSIFNGVVTAVIEDESATVMIQHGGYFSTYSNLSSVAVVKGQTITIGQTLGRAMANMDGIGAVDLYLYDSKGRYFDPMAWLRR